MKTKEDTVYLLDIYVNIKGVTSLGGWLWKNGERSHLTIYIKVHLGIFDGIAVSFQEYYVNEYSDWVNAVVITKENELLVVEQYRHAGEDFFLEVPAGKKEQGESFEEAVVREVKEETGYISLEKPIFLGEFMVNPATQTNKIRTYLIVDAFKSFEQDLDDTEEIKISSYDFHHFGKQITTGEIKTQLFTVSAYYLAKNYIAENKDR